MASAVQQGNTSSASSTVTPAVRGNLPTVQFIADEKEYLTQHGISVEQAQFECREALQHLRQLAEQYNSRRALYEEKIPQTERSLEAVQLLRDRARSGGTVIHTQHVLTSGILSRAKIDVTRGVVGLWLGASVMVEFTYDEAIEFLRKSLDSTRTVLNTLTADERYLDDQINTLTVNMNRLHNYRVKTRTSN